MNKYGKPTGESCFMPWCSHSLFYFVKIILSHIVHDQNYGVFPFVIDKNAFLGLKF